MRWRFVLLACLMPMMARAAQPPAMLNVRDYGAVCDAGSHPLSGLYASLAAAQAIYPFVTSLTQQVDYAALKQTSNVAFGADNAEHGSGGPQLNSPIYLPAGICNLGSDTWTIRNLNGGRIIGAGMTATQLSSTAVALAFDGLWYSTVGDMTITTSGGITALDFDGNTGTAGYTTITAQGDLFPNLLVTNTGSTSCTLSGGIGTSGSCYAVAMCRQGQSSGQCSEIKFINLHTQGGQEAGYFQVGSNALDDILDGGDTQTFPKNGVELQGGSLMVLKTSFEGGAGYSQVLNSGCDVQASSGGTESSINVYGGRSEDICVYNGAFSQWADLRGISQDIGAYITWTSGTHYNLNTVTKQNDPAGVPRMYRVTTAGTTGGLAPTWPASGTVTDGGVTWTMTPFTAVSINEGSFDPQNSHLDSAAGYVTGGGISSLTSCGGGSPSYYPNSTRWGGTVTEGTTATGCVVTFSSGFWFTPKPQCIVTGLNGAPSGYSVTAAALTITNLSASGNTYTWHCWQ